jgi:hypothetical protein
VTSVEDVGYQNICTLDFYRLHLTIRLIQKIYENVKIIMISLLLKRVKSREKIGTSFFRHPGVRPFSPAATPRAPFLGIGQQPPLRLRIALHRIGTSPPPRIETLPPPSRWDLPSANALPHLLPAAEPDRPVPIDSSTASSPCPQTLAAVAAVGFAPPCSQRDPPPNPLLPRAHNARPAAADLARPRDRGHPFVTVSRQP